MQFGKFILAGEMQRVLILPSFVHVVFSRINVLIAHPHPSPPQKKTEHKKNELRFVQLVKEVFGPCWIK